MPLSFPRNGNSTEVVGQVGNLQRVGNPPGTARTQAPSAGCQPARRIPSCPTINAGCSVPRKLSGIGLAACGRVVLGPPAYEHCMRQRNYRVDRGGSLDYRRAAAQAVGVSSASR